MSQPSTASASEHPGPVADGQQGGAVRRRALLVAGLPLLGEPVTGWGLGRSSGCLGASLFEGRRG